MGMHYRPDGDDHIDECARVYYQRVGVTGEITVIPRVECGPITVTCLAGRIVPGHKRGDSKAKPGHQKCTFTVFQELCVAVPVVFDAQAICELKAVHCGPASADPCSDSSGSDSSGSDSSGSDSSGSDDCS